MLARRFALPPINEAHYDPREIPAAERSMDNTCIVRPSREEWLAMLGELVQICNECVRRKAHARKDEVHARAPLTRSNVSLGVGDPRHG